VPCKLRSLGHRQQSNYIRGPIVSQNTLPESIAMSGEVITDELPAGRIDRIRAILRSLGPELITGAADDDPSAIGTYAKAGAAFGFALLWISPVIFPIMSTTVYLCSKVGMVTGMGIAGVLRQHYSKKLLYPVVLAVLVANIIEAGADLGAIAAAIRLIMPVPVTAIILGVTALILGFQTWGSYALLQRIFKWLALALFSYVGAAVLAKPDWSEVIRGTFIPRLQFTSASLSMLVAIVGATLSPYLYFWQASQEVEEKMANGFHHLSQRRGASKPELREAAWDTSLGMLFSCLIMYFIVLCTAATLFKAGHTTIDSAHAAAQALHPLAGSAASMLFAMGVIAVGILAVPVLTTGPAYALAETFDWRHSLDHTPKHAPEFYAVISLSTCVAVAIGFSGINPITALFWAALVMGLLAPPLMLLIMLITNNREIMGDRVNGLVTNILGSIGTLSVSVAALALIWMWIRRG
jgi:NRAMP (natural resistance-associated macrophage protein)-like metal ion transporter